MHTASWCAAHSHLKSKYFALLYHNVRISPAPDLNLFGVRSTCGVRWGRGLMQLRERSFIKYFASAAARVINRALVN